MKKVSREEDQFESELSIALFKDIIKRHFYSKLGTTKKECLCGYCGKTIPKETTVVIVSGFEGGRSKIKLCDENCNKAHEYAETQFFDCMDIENLPTANRKKIRRHDLVYGYHCRLNAKLQNDIDKITDLRKAFQIAVEE